MGALTEQEGAGVCVGCSYSLRWLYRTERVCMLETIVGRVRGGLGGGLGRGYSGERREKGGDEESVKRFRKVKWGGAVERPVSDL